MVLVAKIPCSFGGKKFFIGDSIPEELVEDPKRQEKLGVISIVPVETEEREMPFGKVEISVKDGEGYTTVAVSPDAVNEAFVILQMNTDEAKEAIADIRSSDVLLLLYLAEKRKGVLPAVTARQDELKEIHKSDESEIGGDADGNEGL